MFLEKLELSGFKSFADRTKIEFTRGVTAIVGPNGSGKSNITEAIRWVMGEQSAKSLRGAKMPDVIFSGTQNKKAQNVAEVVATFDNSDRQMGLDGDTVVITRRLYRNGDSDYLINGRKSRLRDIHELFMDTGTGRDSLSIISQGRIEGIFNAKPEERRTIFEEAAGVLKFKTKKAETQQKLGKVQENLDRLEDIIFELKGQLTPLKSQREVALKFQELDGEREKLQLAVLVGVIEAEMKRRHELDSELSELTAELTGLTANQEQFEADLQSLSNARAEVERAMEAASGEILDLTQAKNAVETQLAVADANATADAKTAEERAERVKRLGTERQAKQTELNGLTADLTRLTDLETAVKSEVSELTDFLSGLTGENLEALNDKLRADFLALVEREAELSNGLTRNQAARENLLERSATLSAENAERSERLSAVTADLTGVQGDLTATNVAIEGELTTYRELSSQLTQLSSDLTAATDAQFALLKSRQTLDARLTSLTAIRDNHSNLYAGVAAVMKQGIPGTLGVVADLLTFDSDYQTALEIALGGSVQNIVVENEAVARDSIAYLRDNRLGRATFLPLTTVKPREFRDLAKISGMPGFIDVAVNLVRFDSKIRPAVENLLGATVIVDDLKNAQEIARVLRFSARIVTLDGSQINPNGSFSGGAGKRNTTAFTANDIAKVRSERDALDSELTAAEEAVKRLTASRQTASDALEQSRERGEQLRLTARELEVKVAALEETKSELTELLGLTASDSAGNADLTTLDSEKTTLEGELTALTARKSALEQEISGLTDSTAENRDLAASKQEELTAAQVRLTAVKSDLTHTRDTQKRLTQELEALDAEINQLSAATNPRQTAEEGRETLDARLTEITEKLSELNVRQVSRRFEKDDLTAQMDDLTQQHQGANARYQAVKERQMRAELQLEQVKEHLLTSNAQLASDFNLSYEAAREQLTEPHFDDLSDGQKRLTQLERSIRQLGPVNLDAIAQYDAISERYDFLDSQKSDLLEAKNLLNDNLNEMDDEVRTRFTTSFDAIKASFAQTFRQMFGGGEAQLELTSGDALTAGIEINVQPPGKKLASLTLMSGGEKALTALALLFAILRVREVPFVVLDEVEAALDEANVKRFGDYMTHFESSNQFIVVTHRKGTMKAADVMYGVTMLDAGVSKLISVKFDDIEEK